MFDKIILFGLHPGDAPAPLRWLRYRLMGFRLI